MRCLHPISVYDTGLVNSKTGKRVLRFKPRFVGEVASFCLPCGKCCFCLESRRSQWVKRLQLEYLSNPVASFVTLTYRDAPPLLYKTDLQRFFKRFRHLTRDTGLPLNDFRYFGCGEYGSRFGRPHFHAILFGIDLLSSIFSPRFLHFRSDGFPLYSSPVIERYWPYGFNTVDRVSSRTFRYVAKYVSKHGSSPFAFAGHDEFIIYSRRLGARLFLDFDGSLTPRPLFSTCFGSPSHPIDSFSLEYGKPPSPPPRFLDRYLEQLDPSLYDSVKSRRRAFASSKKPDMSSPLARAYYASSVQSEEMLNRRLDNES